MKARGAGESAHLLLDVSAVLAENGVEYAVIGAMAAAVYGAIRATTDADALLSVSIAKLRQLEQNIQESGICDGVASRGYGRSHSRAALSKRPARQSGGSARGPARARPTGLVALDHRTLSRQFPACDWAGGLCRHEVLCRWSSRYRRCGQSAQDHRSAPRFGAVASDHAPFWKTSRRLAGEADAGVMANGPGDPATRWNGPSGPYQSSASRRRHSARYHRGHTARAGEPAAANDGQV